MIERRTGDILKAAAQALVNTVNCVGIMGRGIALQFTNAAPENFKAYAAARRREEVRPGRMFVFETGRLAPKCVINSPTKRHWRAKSRVADIEAGLAAPAREIRARGIRSIAIPPVGSGLGGLMDPFVTLREARKLLYLMQEAGETLRLRYLRGLHRPYAENLRMELPATVHWAARRQNADDAEAAVAATYAWSDRKRRSSPRRIKIAPDALRSKGWLEAV